MRDDDPFAGDAHGGDISAFARELELPAAPKISLDFSVNVNPFAPHPRLEREFLSMPIEELSRYPEPHAETATAIFAEAHSIPRSQLLLGNGSMELFQILLLALKPKSARCVVPCYSGYAEACRGANVDLKIALTADSAAGFAVDLSNSRVSNGEVLFLASPNNPTGVVLPPAEVLEFAGERPDVFVVLDESFVDFLPDGRERSLFQATNLPANLAVVKSMTKFHAVPGARLGAMRASEKVTEQARSVQLPWSVNALAQRLAKAVAASLADQSEEQLKIRELREEMAADLRNITTGRGPALKIHPGEANFTLCEIRSGARPETARELLEKLLTKGILIRSCSEIPGLGDNFFRIAVRIRDDNKLLVNALREAFERGENNRGEASTQKQNGRLPAKRRFKPIMVLGTTSDAGKTLVAAGLCRRFADTGVDVAPFKAQNMSLNSHVTLDGLEMGRAQVVQAMAARIEPKVDMNPALLKPGCDDGSQVIVNGKPMFNATAREYYAAKNNIRAAAFAAFDRLKAEHELIVLEGAGSPAEINLQNDDFVNTAMAEHANADCVLVADINPGGVFASIYGTVSLIPSRHRSLLKGIIINKFRGDASLLTPGVEEIERLTGLPVLAVLPYFKNLAIDEEDGMALEERTRERAVPKDPSKIDVAVVRLPRISNFTDFLALENSPGVSVRYVSNPRMLGAPDLIIIPGTKNTIADMRFLRESGFESRLRAARKSQIPIFGICGGYQMLGETIRDPDGVESSIREIRALGFLPVETTLTRKKELSRIAGEILNLPFAPKGARFTGYEIHMGATTLATPTRPEGASGGAPPPLLITERGGKSVRELRGRTSSDGLVFGCYAHGFFDAESVRTPLITWLAERSRKSGASSAEKFDPDAERERSFDLLAEHLADVADHLLSTL